MRARLTGPALCLTLLLTACGGGGGGSSRSDTTPPPNQPPVAAASAPTTVAANTRVELNGSDSSDSDGSITGWAWEQVAGPALTVDNADTPIASFTAPPVSAVTEFAFTLTVTDDRGATGSANVSVRVEPPAGNVTFGLSGNILTSPSQIVDGDVNDPATRYVANDSLGTAQRVDNPVTLGGYVNQPGAGAEGRSFAGGDIDDYFSVDLLAGQSISLLVADSLETGGDADLYLFDSRGEIVAFSVETGNMEQVTVPEDGSYTVNVFAFEGATNYILAIGDPGNPSAASAPDFVPGETIISFTDEADREQGPALDSDGLAWQMGLRQQAGDVGRPRLLAMQEAATSLQQMVGTAAGRAGQFAGTDMKERWQTLVAIKLLRKSPGIAAISPNYRPQPQLTTNDPALPFQWHYPLIQLPAAWDITTGSANVTVAVVDSGILRNHPDFAGQLLPGYDFIRDPERAGDGNSIDNNPEDPGSGRETGSSYHGSHVAGTVAATGNNSVGGAGAAFGVRLMPLRALSESGGTSYDVLQAVRYAAGLDNDSGTLPGRPADIINLSLGGEGFSGIAENLYRQVRSAGIVVVAAAGNEASSFPSYPAAYDAVLSVSAVDARRQLASYSNRGPLIDLAGPGGDSSQDVGGDGYPDGVLSNGAVGSGGDREFAYTFLNGTSMAAPHVSAVIALMKSVNPELSPAAIEQLLRDGRLTDDLGPPGRDDSYGYGLINAYRAVTAAMEAGGGSPVGSSLLSASATAFSFGSSLEQLDLTLEASGSDTVQILGLDSSEPWLTIVPVQVAAGGLGDYRLQVDRNGLDTGIYSGTVTIRSSANALQLRVQMAVGDGSSSDSDLGTLYLLLYHPDSDAVVDQAVLQSVNGGYRYRFDRVSAGRYQIYAGTDADNDFMICDAGEACGAWLTYGQPAEVVLDRDLENIDFPVDFLVYLPGMQSLEDADSSPAYQRRTP
ncbi:S8 family serine peptidase [Parahaliea aestuarii]|uniref:S8 family serine peptidase n=1 Tax=Parahaliea aestuarii TaxID=1852021 RepID=A0A5C9A581_9GAMM|nr:S8 family serine peptidase [Parahaliea aestuarii]TXS94361.1 S8 family serine peptidase [Parahaliea aestuarii]